MNLARHYKSYFPAFFKCTQLLCRCLVLNYYVNGWTLRKPNSYIDYLPVQIEYLLKKMFIEFVELFSEDWKYFVPQSF